MTWLAEADDVFLVLCLVKNGCCVFPDDDVEGVGELIEIDPVALPFMGSGGTAWPSDQTRSVPSSPPVTARLPSANSKGADGAIVFAEFDRLAKFIDSIKCWISLAGVKHGA